MHSLFQKYGHDVPSLYVKAAPYTFDMRDIFDRARLMAPCLLVFEDIDTIVTPDTRSYFFNEVDGLANNNGLFIVGSTNHLDQLDPGLSSRPSRFDRKYLFPLPSEEERVLYCEYWREKLKGKPGITFPPELSPAIAAITQDFSFAFLKEAFVSTLLIIAGNRSEKANRGGGDDLDKYELWKEIQIQIKQLRKDMENKSGDSLDYFATSSNVPGRFPSPVQAPSTHYGDRALPTDHLLRTTQISSQAPRASQAAVGNIGTRPAFNPHQAPLMTDEGFFIDRRFGQLQLNDLL